MRELAVFYCPKCGHYAYYQTSRHPQCPKCGCEEAMYMVRMHYTEFMRMSCDERDEFLSKEILKTLSAVKAQYEKFGQLISKTQKKLQEAQSAADDLQSRNEMIQKKLSKVEMMDEADSSKMLGIAEDMEY